MNVEAPDEATFDVAQAGFANRADPVQLERADDAAERSKPEPDHQTLNGMAPRTEHGSPTEVSPAIKRKLVRNPGAPNFERKRIKFTETVEERPEYRGSLEFYRGAKEYVPGRYVAAEGSEYLDTSGSTLSFAKFTGQKKVGSTFVDIVPKVEAKESEGGGTATKRQDKVKSKKKQNDQKEGQPESQNNETQMIDRELRNTGRSLSITPPLTTRPRRKTAQYDGKDDEAAEQSYNRPSLVAVLRTSLPGEASTLLNENISAHIPKHAEEVQRSHIGPDVAETALNDTAKEAAEAANISETLGNIRRELSILQQTTFTSKHRDVVWTAIQSFFKVLESLNAVLMMRPNEDKEAGEAPEEDSIYFEALDATDKLVPANTPHLSGRFKRSKIDTLWTDATPQVEETDAAGANPTLDANVLDAIPKEDEQNTSGVLELDKIEDGNDQHQDRLVPSIEAASGGTSTQAKKKRVIKPRSSAAPRDSKSVKYQPIQSRDLPDLETKPRRHSRKMGSTAPPNYRSPSYDFEEAPTPPALETLRTARVARSLKSQAGFLIVRLDDEESETEDEDTNGSNALMSNQAAKSEFKAPKPKVQEALSNSANKQSVNPASSTAEDSEPT
jgi:hypothetical protein